MEKLTDKSLKPIVLKTDLGFSYFDYNDIIMFKADEHNVLCYTLESKNPIKVFYSLKTIEKRYCNELLCRCMRSNIINPAHIERIEMKTHKMYLKNNIVIHISDECLRLFKKSIVNECNPNNGNAKNQNKDQNIYEMKKIQFYKITTLKEIKKYLRKSFGKFFQVLFTVLFVLLLNCCESNDRFYRPNLPGKLCCVGIIDVDDTTLHYISFEKSFQSEYPDELNDSLRNFSFSISSTEKELFNYQNDNTIKELKEFEIPANIEFRTGEKYYINAQENSTSKISAITNVPQPPSEPLIVSIKYENIITNPLPCLVNINRKLANIGFSFVNDPEQNLYYALLMEGSWLDSEWPSDPLAFEARSFEVTECNTTGFFAPVWGYTQNLYHCAEDRLDTTKAPLTCYFIEGSKIPGNKCILKVSTTFLDYIEYKENKKIRIKVLSIPKDFFLFEKSLYTYKKNASDPFSEPVYLNGNIKNGNGIFAICRSTDIIINLPKPLPLY